MPCGSLKLSRISFMCKIRLFLLNHLGIHEIVEILNVLLPYKIEFVVADLNKIGCTCSISGGANLPNICFGSILWYLSRKNEGSSVWLIDQSPLEPFFEFSLLSHCSLLFYSFSTLSLRFRYLQQMSSGSNDLTLALRFLELTLLWVMLLSEFLFFIIFRRKLTWQCRHQAQLIFNRLVFCTGRHSWEIIRFLSSVFLRKYWKPPSGCKDRWSRQSGS